MRLQIDGHETYVATGGKTLNPALPAVVFIHGSGLDHRSWALQTRWFAFRDYAVVAPDLPGHSLSAGEPLTSIEAMATWVWRLLDTLGIERCAFVGHSQGALVALAAAAQQPQRAQALSIVAAAAAIPVNPQLLELSRSARPKAVAAMLQWGFGEDYQWGRSRIPGQAPIGIGSRIMTRNPLDADLAACQAYTDGERAAQTVQAPAQLVLAQHDKMTPLRSGQALSQLFQVAPQLDILDAGHMLPIEAPEATLDALRRFIVKELSA